MHRARLVEDDEPTERCHRLDPPAKGRQLRKNLAAREPGGHGHDVALTFTRRAIGDAQVPGSARSASPRTLRKSKPRSGSSFGVMQPAKNRVSFANSVPFITEAFLRSRPERTPAFAGAPFGPRLSLGGYQHGAKKNAPTTSRIDRVRCMLGSRRVGAAGRCCSDG